MGEGAGGERCDWLRELPAEALGPPPLRSGLGCGGAGAAALCGGRERRGPARGVRPETAPRARRPPPRRGARCRRRARCRSVAPAGARGDASGPRGSSRSCGPLGHTFTPMAGPCPELKALRSPAPRPRGRAGQRQVLQPAASRVPRGAQRASERRCQAECRPEPFSGLNNKRNK